MYCGNKQFSTAIEHKSSKFASKVHYTLIMNKMIVVFAFRPLTIVLYTLSYIRGSFFMFVESGCISTNIEFTVP